MHTLAYDNDFQFTLRAAGDDSCQWSSQCPAWAA
jgi:hypothetical protein